MHIDKDIIQFGSYHEQQYIVCEWSEEKKTNNNYIEKFSL